MIIIKRIVAWMKPPEDHVDLSTCMRHNITTV